MSSHELIVQCTIYRQPSESYFLNFPPTIGGHYFTHLENHNHFDIRLLQFSLATV